MKKRLLAVLLVLVLLLTGIPAIPAQAKGDDDLKFECVTPFSEGLAWIRYKDKNTTGLGVINEDFELVYALNTEMAEGAFYREKGDHLDFEVYSFRDGIAYYQAEGYGYVIIDDEGEELASDIWTAVHQPYIMARGEDYFMVREYDALEESWTVYAINAHGKVKGKKVSYEDQPDYRYIGSGLYIGTGGEEEEVFYSEDEKKTFENENFHAEDFYGFSDYGEGFVFLDGDYDKAYMISEYDMKDEDEWEDWADDADWFDADESTVEYYNETVGSNKFYSAYDEAYIDFEGDIAVNIPDFGKYEPVSFGRFQDGVAPVLLVNNKGAYYITYIDDWGDPVYEPIYLGKTEDGSDPVLTDAFYKTGYQHDEDDDTTYIVYGNGTFTVEVDGGALFVDRDGAQISVVDATYGADDNYYYMSSGVIDRTEGKVVDRIQRTDETQDADLDWLVYANFAGIYDGSDGSILILLADGTGYYREPQSTTKEDLLQGVEITFELVEGNLVIYNLAYPIYADVTGFEGSMLMLATDPGWHEEEFVRRDKDKEVPVAELLDPDAKLPEVPVTPTPTPGGEDPKPSPDPGPTPHVDPYLYGTTHFSFRPPQFWIDRGVQIEIPEPDNIVARYRGLVLMTLYVMPSSDYTGGDPSCYCVESWDLGDGNIVVMWIQSYSWDVTRYGDIPARDYMKSPGYTYDGDLEDILYTVTGIDFDISKIKGKFSYENPNEDVNKATSAEYDFYMNKVAPGVKLY